MDWGELMSGARLIPSHLVNRQSTDVAIYDKKGKQRYIHYYCFGRRLLPWIVEGGFLRVTGRLLRNAFLAVSGWDSNCWRVTFVVEVQEPASTSDHMHWVIDCCDAIFIASECCGKRK